MQTKALSSALALKLYVAAATAILASCSGERQAEQTATADVSSGASAPVQQQTSIQQASAPRVVPVNLQAASSTGVTLRVKAVEIGADATLLDVSASYASRIASSTTLALTDTYLLDQSGARLPLKRPDDNRDLAVRDGDTMNGKLVFLGAVAPDSDHVTLVVNDGNDADNVAGPGLRILIPLTPQA